MSAEDIRIFDSLPEQIGVWRGTNYKRSVNGLSWTLDPGEGCLVRAKALFKVARPARRKRISKEGDVLAYFGDRNEREIISTRVSIISIIEISRANPS